MRSDSHVDRRQADPGPVIGADARWTLFGVGLAAAALFHLAGNPRPLFSAFDPTLTVIQVAVGVAAVAVCVRPRRRRLILLCALIPISAWLEAPLVGNHWVLAAVIAVTALFALLKRPTVTANAAEGRDDDASAWSAFAPAARLVVVIAYGFAAFAKLNADFFDPAVSCAVYYHNQLVSSWGLGALSASGRPQLGMAIAVAAACVELAVPVLLVVRRTRRLGVVLGLSFHWLLALDLAQHFWDFTSVLFVGFLLFADERLGQWIVATVRTARGRVRGSIQTLLAALGLTAAAIAIAPSVFPSSLAVRGAAVLTGHVAWILVGTGMLLVVVTGSLKVRAHAERRALRVTAPAMALIPVLVALNGLTPYLELKTGFGWNMYSNLRTVDGSTNHFIIPATLDLTGLQQDTVEILDASDPAVAALGREDYAVVYSEFREYAHRFPEESVTYRRGDDVHDAARLADDPAGEGGVSVISHRLQSFRVIDMSGSERCLSRFSPAR